MKTAEEFLATTNIGAYNAELDRNEYTEEEVIKLLNEFANQFKYDYSKNCNCKDSTGSTWCCNQCGLPTTRLIMKTIKEWLNEIPEPEIREAALRNMDLEYKDVERDCLSDAIHASFSWGSSIEGVDFWRDFYNNLINENK